MPSDKERITALETTVSKLNLDFTNMAGDIRSIRDTLNTSKGMLVAMFFIANACSGVINTILSHYFN